MEVAVPSVFFSTSVCLIIVVLVFFFLTRHCQVKSGIFPIQKIMLVILKLFRSAYNAFSKISIKLEETWRREAEEICKTYILNSMKIVIHNELSLSTVQYEHLELIRGCEATESVKQWNECKKNPGHEGFIPASQVCLNDLPEGCRNERVLKAVKLVCDLTVRLRVSNMSSDRPNYIAATEETGNFCVGTGRIVDISQGVEACSCTTCAYRPEHRHKWWSIGVITAGHVVFNTEEAALTRADLYFDDECAREDGRMKTCMGVRVMQGKTYVDWSYLQCALHDEATAAKVTEDLRQLSETVDHLCEQPGDPALSKTVVVVSHPHGRTKYVTFGELLLWNHGLNYLPYIDENFSCVHGDIRYDAPTCPGSSGAVVMWLGFHPHLLPQNLAWTKRDRPEYFVNMLALDFYRFMWILADIALFYLCSFLIVTFLPTWMQPVWRYVCVLILITVWVWGFLKHKLPIMGRISVQRYGKKCFSWRTEAGRLEILFNNDGYCYVSFAFGFFVMLIWCRHVWVPTASLTHVFAVVLMVVLGPLATALIQLGLRVKLQQCFSVQRKALWNREVWIGSCFTWSLGLFGAWLRYADHGWFGFIKYSVMLYICCILLKAICYSLISSPEDHIITKTKLGFWTGWRFWKLESKEHKVSPQTVLTFVHNLGFQKEGYMPYNKSGVYLWHE